LIESAMRLSQKKVDQILRQEVNSEVFLSEGTAYSRAELFARGLPPETIIRTADIRLTTLRRQL
jgi:hypothetical protein